MLIKSKLPNVGTTIFTVMSKLATEQGAINLSQGFPDFACDPELISLVEKHMRSGHNQYAPMPGVISLREQIAEKTEKLYGRKINPETEITVTSGATEGLFAAIHAVAQPGDEVIIFEPAYDSYIPAIELAGAIAIPIHLTFPDYKIEWNVVKSKISDKTKLIIINSPHNPTGAILTKPDLDHLRDLVKDSNILIISDEVYEHIIFDGHKHDSVLNYPELADRAFVISSFGKTFHTTGWKTGYCVAPASLSAEFRKVHQFLTFSSNTPVQLAIAEYLKKEEKYMGLPAFYQEKRDYFLKLIKGSRFKPLTCSGTYFQLLSYEGLFEESDMELAKKITIENKVASIPISVFYQNQQDNKVLRFCFAKENLTLEIAAERLCKI